MATSPTSHFVQLEEFDESLRGRRICTYLPSGGTTGLINYIRLVISNVQMGGEPFTRIIAVTSDPLYRILADCIGATVIVGAKDNSDLSLVLTAASQVAASTLVIFFPDIVRCPEAFFARLPASCTFLIIRANDDTTVIGGCNTYMMPYVKELNSAEHSLVTRRLGSLGLSTGTDINAILKELRVAQAGLLVWLKGGYQSPELFWWNTAEEVPSIRRKSDVIANILRFIADIVYT